MEMYFKVLKIEYTTLRLPDNLISKFSDFVLRLETLLGVKFAKSISDDDFIWIAFHGENVSLTLLSIEPLNVYEIKIKTTTPSLAPSIFKAISEQFEYYNLEEILEKISNTNGYNERYLGILNDVAVNGEKVDFRVVNLYSEAIGGGDPDIRASVPWYIYNNSHYWLPCIDFVLKAFQKENVERVKISISGALEMIIKDFLENTISSFYNEGIFENAFGTSGNDFNNTLNKLLNRGGGYDEILEYIIEKALDSQEEMLEINGIWSIYYIGKNYKTSLWDKFIPIINHLIAEGGNDEVIANGRTMLNWISSSRKI